jgi:hypothetical protein
MDVTRSLPQCTTKTDLLLLPKHIQCLHYDGDYVEIEWNINAIKSEPYLLNLKIRTQNIHGVNLLSDSTSQLCSSVHAAQSHTVTEMY